MDNSLKIKYAFFGSSQFSVYVLDELAKAGFKPTCIVTTPDKPQGRKMIMTPTVVKAWGVHNSVKVYDPAKLDSAFVKAIKAEGCGVFIVASYGKIIPASVFELPPRKTLNVHPSLLPKYRGASPLQSAILEDAKKTGVTIMNIDAVMDHGPIVAQKEVTVNEWPTYEAFEEMMAREGGRLLASVLPEWAAGRIVAKEQDHSLATYTKKTTKEDGLIDLNDSNGTTARENFLKIQAYHEWPQAFFMINKNGKDLRVKVIAASFKSAGGGELTIEKVVPEGSKEMSYEDFKRGYL